jgi:hypothetical protein
VGTWAITWAAGLIIRRVCLRGERLHTRHRGGHVFEQVRSLARADA